ncbi:phage tail assembly protein [Azospirillum doebereinerae]
MDNAQIIGPRRLALAAPFTVNGLEISELTLRRPKVADLRRMDAVKGGDLAKTLWMIGQLAGLSPQEVDEIDAGDLEAIAEVVAGFTGKGRD